MPFVAAWMDLEIITLSEVSQRQMPYDMTYVWNLKRKNTNELIYKTETDSKTQRTNLWLPCRERLWGGMVREFGN